MRAIWRPILRHLVIRDLVCIDRPYFSQVRCRVEIESDIFDASDAPAARCG